jgi:YidC/Oxa1 family membrane protein insertase
MDRNTVIGFVLIGLILIGYSYYNFEQAQKAELKKAKTKTEKKKDTAQQPDAAYVGDADNSIQDLAQSGDSVAKAKLAENLGVFATALEGTEKIDTVKTEDLAIAFSNKGGNIKSITLNNYKTYDKKPLVLFSEGQNEVNYQFFINNNRDVNTRDLYFNHAEVTKDKEGNKVVTYKLDAGNGAFFEQQYTIPNKGYTVGYNVNLSGMQNVIPKNSTYINMLWKRTIQKVEQSKDFENRYTQLHYRYTNEDYDYLSETENAEASLATPVQWVSCKQQFFNTTIINKDGFYSGTVRSTLEPKADLIKTFENSMILSYNHQKNQQYRMEFYFGPNHYQTLKSYNIGLEKIIPLGTGIMSWVSVFNKYFIIPIFNFLEGFIASYGIIILILTLIIKTILFPLTYKSYKSAALMKALKLCSRAINNGCTGFLCKV